MEETRKPTIVVMGAGGMGGLFGSILKEGGAAVTLVDVWKDHVDAIRRDGLKVVGFGGDRTVRIAATTEASEVETADLVLFQCKAHATEAAARASRHLIEGGAVAVSFQNGLGNEDVIGSVVGPENVLGGLTGMAGRIEAPGAVRDFSRAPSHIGEMGGGVSARVETFAAALSAAGLETHASANITRDIWKKLLANIATSAASGATNLTSARVHQVPQLKATCLRALEEALAVANAVGIDLDRAEAVRKMEEISRPGGTGDNKTSLCVDILNKRPTEVDFIYGSVIALGEEKGVPTPTLDTLASIVKGLESRYIGGAG